MVPFIRKRIALIPAYKPTKTLITLLMELNGNGFECITVNDGSGDDFTDIFNAAEKLSQIISYNENHGKGHALKKGFAYISENYEGSYTIVTLDADGQHGVSDVVRVCDLLEQDIGSPVLGCRSFKNGVPVRSKLGNRAMCAAYSLSTSETLHDTQTGLRAFDSQLLPLLISTDGQRYEYEMNVLLELSRRKIPIREIEISTIYIDSNSGSHFNAIRDSARVVREIVKFSACSLASFALDYGLYCLLCILTVRVELSNILARIASATFNYTLNRTLVFKSKNGIAGTAFGYFLLAVVILAGNTVMLSLLTKAGFNGYIAKLMTEIVFFAVSWLVQKYIIFRNKAKK